MFVFLDEADKEGAKKGQPQFARSFIQQSWEGFEEEYFKDYEPEEETEISFSVDFAWSCWSCLIDGYPTENKKKNPEGFGDCETLEWACKKHNVKVDIETEEEGEGFEEHIVGDKNGINYECKDMPTYTCTCGCKMRIPTNADLSEYSCYECNRVGEWEDKLTKMIERKIENAEV